MTNPVQVFIIILSYAGKPYYDAWKSIVRRRVTVSMIHNEFQKRKLIPMIVSTSPGYVGSHDYLPWVCKMMNGQLYSLLLSNKRINYIITSFQANLDVVYLYKKHASFMY